MKTSKHTVCDMVSTCLQRVRRCLTVAVLMLAVPLTHAQDVQVQMTLPPPGTLNPDDLTEIVSFHNTNPYALWVHMIVTIEEDETGLVFHGTSAIFEVPPGVSIPDYQDLEPFDIEYTDPVLEDYVIQTNSLPGGDYVVCILLVEAEMGEEAGYNCLPHSVFHPSAPMLVYPADGDVVHEPAPLIVWLPPSPYPMVELSYTLRMVEVLEGQLSYEAMQSNPAFFEDMEVMENTYMYPAHAASMKDGQTYALQVQALMAGGFPVGENDGYSEIHMFQYSDFISDDRTLTWIDPLDGDQVDQPHPLFRWSDPAFEDGLPPTGHYYLFQIIKLEEVVEDDDELVIAEEIVFSDITVPFFIYPSYAHPLQQGSYSVQVFRMHLEGYVPGMVTIVDPHDIEYSIDHPPGFSPDDQPVTEAMVTASSPEIFFSYKEATLEACCDTITVMNKIWDDIDTIKEDICVVKKDLMDQLLDALDDYMDKQWDANALQGRLDAAANFKVKLQAFKDQALEGLQSEIDRLSDLKGDCNTQWESAFHERYVANPLVGGSHEVKQWRYERAVRSVQRRFDRRLQIQLNGLQRRKDQTESRYDDLMGHLDAYTADAQDAHNQAQQEADEALSQVNDFFNQIRDNLCGIEGQWENLFAFMMDTFCCITKCAEEQVPVPPEFAEMEDCLKDLFNRLVDWKANIREPGDQNELKDQASNVFDADRAMEQLQELLDLAAELDVAIKDFNSQSPHLQLVDRACYSLHMYASGGHSPGRVYTPFDHRGTRYGAPIIPRSFAYRATGEYAPSRQVRREASRERRAFQQEHGRTINEMNRLASRLSRGNAENGFARPEAIEAHGKAAAVPHHEHTAHTLDHLIDQMLDAWRGCYDLAKHHRQRRAFNEIMTECVAFREALRELDGNYADHAEKTAEEEARLRDRLAEVDQLIRQLRERLIAAGSAAEALEEKIGDIKRKIEELQGEQVHPDLSAGKQEVLRELRQRLTELERQLREAKAYKSDASRILGELERLRDQIRDAIDKFGEVTPPSPIGSTEEANEASGRVEEERREKEQENQRIGDLINEAGRLLNEASEACGDASKRASGGLSAGDGLLGEIYEWLEHLRRRSEAIREHERRRRQADCLRLLEEYRAARDTEPGLLSRIWEFFWMGKEELEVIPEGYHHDVDDFMDYLHKLEEFKERVEQALTLIRGINTDDAEARAKALAEVLRIAGELGGEVPGFGEMIEFYAKAYEAAIAAIQEIGERRRRPAKETVEKHIDRIGCRPDAWHGSSLEELLESYWQQFLSTGPGSSWLNDWFGFFPKEKALIEAYFKEKMAARIMECCIKELMKGM